MANSKPSYRIASCHRTSRRNQPHRPARGRSLTTYTSLHPSPYKPYLQGRCRYVLFLSEDHNYQRYKISHHQEASEFLHKLHWCIGPPSCRHFHHCMRLHWPWANKHRLHSNRNFPLRYRGSRHQDTSLCASHPSLDHSYQRCKSFHHPQRSVYSGSLWPDYNYPPCICFHRYNLWQHASLSPYQYSSQHKRRWYRHFHHPQ